MTYLGGFCYPNNLVLKKGIAVMSMSFTRGEFTLSKQNLVTDIYAVIASQRSTNMVSPYKAKRFLRVSRKQKN